MSSFDTAPRHLSLHLSCAAGLVTVEGGIRPPSFLMSLVVGALSCHWVSSVSLHLQFVAGARVKYMSLLAGHPVKLFSMTLANINKPNAPLLKTNECKW